jgi:hypothetical protein
MRRALFGLLVCGLVHYAQPSDLLLMFEQRQKLAPLTHRAQHSARSMRSENETNKVMLIPRREKPC